MLVSTEISCSIAQLASASPRPSSRLRVSIIALKSWDSPSLGFSPTSSTRECPSMSTIKSWEPSQSSTCHFSSLSISSYSQTWAYPILWRFLKFLLRERSTRLMSSVPCRLMPVSSLNRERKKKRMPSMPNSKTLQKCKP